jgi:hypothetical protein
MAGKTKVKCEKCEGFYNSSQIKKHKDACKGIIPFVNKPIEICPYCKIKLKEKKHQIKINHMRWCIANPKYFTYRENASIRALGAAPMQTEKARKKASEGIKKAHREGKYKEYFNSIRGKPGHLQTKETKEKLSEIGRKLTYRRLMRHQQLFYKKDGTIIILDSSWEVVLAQRLDYLDIDWVRPKPIPWVDRDGKEHHYFPDFYLPKYNVYLDPKNSIVQEQQKEKIELLLEKYLPNLIIIKTKEECENFIWPIGAEDSAVDL